MSDLQNARDEYATDMMMTTALEPQHMWPPVGRDRGFGHFCPALPWYWRINISKVATNTQFDYFSQSCCVLSHPSVRQLFRAARHHSHSNIYDNRSKWTDWSVVVLHTGKRAAMAPVEKECTLVCVCCHLLEGMPLAFFKRNVHEKNAKLSKIKNLMHSK